MPALAGGLLGLLNTFGDSKCLHNYLCGTVVISESEALEGPRTELGKGKERE